MAADYLALTLFPKSVICQPSIRCSSQSPQPGTSRAAAAEEEIQVEDEDVYGESLPELSYSHRIIQHRRSRAQSRSLDDPTAGTGVSSSRGSSTGREISISMGEVIVHSEPEEEFASFMARTGRLRGGERYLESTRSLSYLEWVHEKQTKRMLTRSEWFLSPPTMPAKNNGGSKSVDFPTGRFSSPMRLTLPKQDEDCLGTSSGDEDMSSIFPSSSSSMKCSPRPISTTSAGGESKMSLDPSSKAEASPAPSALEEEEREPISPLVSPRKPFQLIQQRQYSSTTEGSVGEPTPPASAPDTVCRTFFGISDQPITIPSTTEERKEEEKEQLPGTSLGESHSAGTMTKTTSSSSGSSSTATVATAIASVALGHGNGNGGNGKEGANTSQQRVTSSGVVRRRSWRTHYTRPNKSLEESGNVREEVAPSSHSTPLRHSPTSSIGRRDSGPASTSVGLPSTSSSSSTRAALIRRKSSGNGGSAGAKPKAPVQTRRSTQI
ncbi:RhoGAP domain protein [Ditylenchus destructor]|nr:RhoGAP domain protein [Ditylenchus destructor]